MKKQRRGLNGYNMLLDRWRSLVCQTTPLKVKSMQRSGTEATRAQIQTSKPKRDITNITNKQNTKRTYGQPNEQLFPKGGHSATETELKNNMHTHKVKRHRNSDTQKVNREPQQNYRIGTVRNELLGGGGFNQFYGPNLTLSF